MFAGPDTRGEPSDPARFPGIWTLVLAGLMAILKPLSFASEASGALTRVLGYGAPALLLLVFRIGVAGLGIAAGRALWSVRPTAPALARAWLALDAAAMTATALTPYFPSNHLPGTKWPMLGFLVAVNGGWLVYLSCASRVREAYGATDAISTRRGWQLNRPDARGRRIRQRSKEGPRVVEP